MLKDWQGVPPMRRSIDGYLPLRCSVSRVIWVKSPKLGVLGNLCASTAQAKGSISLTNAHLHPNGSHAMLAASIPLHTDPNTNPSAIAPDREGWEKRAAAQGLKHSPVVRPHIRPPIVVGLEEGIGKAHRCGTAGCLGGFGFAAITHHR